MKIPMLLFFLQNTPGAFISILKNILLYKKIFSNCLFTQVWTNLLSTFEKQLGSWVSSVIGENSVSLSGEFTKSYIAYALD